MPTRGGEHERNAGALLIWWDLGPRAAPDNLEAAQGLIAELVSAASLLLAAEARSIRYPRSLLLPRGNRLYLRRDEAARSRDVSTPSVVAAGYSNPWWEVLQDLSTSLQVIGAAGAGTAVVAFVDKLIDLTKKVALFSDDLAATRHALRSTIEQDRDGDLRVLRAADDVDGQGVTREERWSRNPHTAPRPSVSRREGFDDPLVALAADRVLEAVSHLARAVGQNDDFGSKLMDVQAAVDSLDVIRDTQASLLELARGDVGLPQFEERILRRSRAAGANPSELRRPTAPGELGP